MPPLFMPLLANLAPSSSSQSCLAALSPYCYAPISAQSTKAGLHEGSTVHVKVEGLIAAIRTGDKAAADALLEQFQPLLLRIAARYRGVSFEDALQEARLALWQCVQSYDLDGPVPFAGYAAVMVHGRTRTAMRRWWSAREKEVYPDAHRQDDGSTLVEMASMEALFGGSDVDAAERSAVEWRLLMHQAGLSPRERLSLEGLMAGMSCTELAKRMGVSAETAKTWRKRAVAKMRTVLRRADEA